MTIPPPDFAAVADLLDLSLKEDLGSGDVTTDSVVRIEAAARGRFKAKAEGVVCGLPLLEFIFSRHCPEGSFVSIARDGQRVRAGELIATLEAPARSALKLERLMLNFLQRLSGVATLTARFVEAVGPDGAAILDTRKTTPLWRILEKYAVRCGGGQNHRMGLYDQVLIKDNHLALLAAELGNAGAGGCIGTGTIIEAVRRSREKAPGLIVQVEVRDIRETREACGAGADLILLDNMSLKALAESAGFIRQWREAGGAAAPLSEASGGVSLENARSVAQTGVDRISIGALTHSAPALDISLKLASL
ncbi:MAG TPA: carboxylating nicotinate-nucleotide diphosphorylase [Candidatus Brocadiia bacterium]|nr:carboxylating nicotinate-nucleotide diphosphorylase [Candidatus Brocadiia bacterium]